MKMKKINSQGFVLAETLVVTVFLMIIFSMIYSNFYPLIGEYEKREYYDDVDGKYAVYWLKRIIEDSSYNLSSTSLKMQNLTQRKFVRFECSDVAVDDDKRTTCKNMVKALQVEGCNKEGDGCEIYITNYQIGTNQVNSSDVFFKNTVESGLRKYEENCFTGNCKDAYITACNEAVLSGVLVEKNCTKRAEKKIFRTGLADYIYTLPNYSTESLNYAKYRVIASFHHTKDNNNYYSYATIEVNK